MLLSNTNREFFTLKKTLKALKDASDTESKIYLVIGWAYANKTSISEYNLITLLRFAGIDFNDASDLTYIYTLLPFWAGAKLLEFTDNGLGLFPLIYDEASSAFKNGEESDENGIRESFNQYRDSQELYLYDLISEANDEQADSKK